MYPHHCFLAQEKDFVPENQVEKDKETLAELEKLKRKHDEDKKKWLQAELQFRLKQERKLLKQVGL